MSASACALPVLGAPFGDGPSFNLTFGELVASPSGDIGGAAAENTGGAEKPKAPTTALAVKVKPVIPGVPGMAKLPNGWRMVTGADGKP